MIRVSEHAERRIHQRIGTSREQQFAVEAWEHGVKPADVVGQFRGYLDGFGIRDGLTPRIHRGRLWLFGRDDVLVTVMPVKRQWTRAALKAERRARAAR